VGARLFPGLAPRAFLWNPFRVIRCLRAGTSEGLHQADSSRDWPNDLNGHIALAVPANPPQRGGTEQPGVQTPGVGCGLGLNPEGVEQSPLEDRSSHEKELRGRRQEEAARRCPGPCRQACLRRRRAGTPRRQGHIRFLLGTGRYPVDPDSRVEEGVCPRRDSRDS